MSAIAWDVPKRHRGTARGTLRDLRPARWEEKSTLFKSIERQSGMFWRIRPRRRLNDTDDFTADAPVSQRALSGERRHVYGLWINYA